MHVHLHEGVCASISSDAYHYGLACGLLKVRRLFGLRMTSDDGIAVSDCNCISLGACAIGVSETGSAKTGSAIDVPMRGRY